MLSSSPLSASPTTLLDTEQEPGAQPNPFSYPISYSWTFPRTVPSSIAVPFSDPAPESVVRAGARVSLQKPLEHQGRARTAVPLLAVGLDVAAPAPSGRLVDLGDLGVLTAPTLNHNNTLGP